MLYAGQIQELVQLMNYGLGEKGRLGNRGFADVGKLIASRADINKICKPFCKREM